ncbi:TetR/AcrR family transcriptional regulator [Kutzneria viridogrisea]|uniref:HTH tetR-type domain-containing protein n=2 Tax=Kutzneria TaxID=43356 RepID=W5W112_9PSEU|nr:TetR/AcrR family transcriptional regulator [Kutzneria albida]AHH94868.1 hypothetical protein KALB_1495 [Kutzneria albida DSM 43870]MBA8927788.1 AcrR family transcriptional regulator [Kutzneria viridogrisea]
MSTEERRETIAVAALPLLAEHGTDVTTSQIAKAAGIAEGTVFRVFKDKQELLDFCVLRAFQTHETLELIDSLPDSTPLVERLVQAVGALAEAAGRAGALMHALGATGYRPDESRLRKSASKEHEHPINEEFKKATTALAKLLGSGSEVLRVPAEQAAGYLLGLTFVGQMQAKRSGGPAPEVAELVDLFLHGAVGATTNQGGKDR